MQHNSPHVQEENNRNYFHVIPQSRKTNIESSKLWIYHAPRGIKSLEVQKYPQVLHKSLDGSMLGSPC